MQSIFLRKLLIAYPALIVSAFAAVERLHLLLLISIKVHNIVSLPVAMLVKLRHAHQAHIVFQLVVVHPLPSDRLDVVMLLLFVRIVQLLL